MMNSVSVQIQRAINEATSSQILPQIQNAVMAGSGQLTKERWNVPAERPEGYSEVLQNLEPRNNSKSKQANDRPKDGFTSTNPRAYDMVTGVGSTAELETKGRWIPARRFPVRETIDI